MTLNNTSSTVLNASIVELEAALLEMTKNYNTLRVHLGIEEGHKIMIDSKEANQMREGIIINNVLVKYDDEDAAVIDDLITRLKRAIEILSK